MTNLTVCKVDGILVVDSRLIAERLNVEHSSFIEIVEKYKTLAETEFGSIRFETGLKSGVKRGGKQPRYALLTEPQATFFMTLSRNTSEVVWCKIDLVVAFENAKSALNRTKTPAEIHLEQAQLIVDQERRVKVLETKHLRIEAQQVELREENRTLRNVVEAHDAELTRSNNTHGRYYSICGYAAVLGIEMPYGRAVKMGKAASALCRELKKPIGKVPDPRFGRVGTYPESVLQTLPW